MNKTTVSYIVIVVLLVVTSMLSLNLFFRQRTDNDKVDIHSFPHTIGDWEGRDLEITDKEYEILETRNLISREYTNISSEKIYLFIVYSETNRSVFHPPEVCLMGSGMTIVDKQREPVKDNKLGFLANKLYLGKGNSKNIVLYCYKVGDFYTDNIYLQQGLFAINQLLRKHKGGATIRVSMLVVENKEKAVATLKGFMKKAIAELEKLT